jgi:general secretion pathway protein A
MLVQYFGFQHEPFGASADPRCLYLSHTHREALASLEYGFVSNRGFTAMIAPPGMGKTTLLFRFLNNIRASARNVFLFDIDPQCEPRDFVGYILRDIGITPARGSAEMHEQLTGALVAENRAGRKFVVVIDEAQNLSDAVLERVRLLSNFETSRGKLMQIVLSGQPHLSDKLMQPSLVQLRQRISTVCRIAPLSANETAGYIQFRLKQAGHDGVPLFTDEALRKIAKASDGIPRTINNLCFNSLSLCCALKCRQVDDRMVDEAIADLQLVPRSESPAVTESESAPKQPFEPKSEKHPKRPLKRFLIAATAMVVLCAAGVLGLAALRISAASGADEERSLDQSTWQAPIALPAVADANGVKAEESGKTPEKFEITVQPDQKLQDIAVQYLGGFDLRRLHQIQALNPKLTDPDHIEAGQEIWLPGSAPAPVAEGATAPTGERNRP